MYETREDEEEEIEESEWKKRGENCEGQIDKKKRHKNTYENVRKHRKKSQTANWGDDLIKAPLNWAQLSILCNQSFNIMKYAIHYT